MAVPVGQLGENFAAKTATVGILTSVHMDVVLDVVELGILDAAVLAHK